MRRLVSMEGRRALIGAGEGGVSRAARSSRTALSRAGPPLAVSETGSRRWSSGFGDMRVPVRATGRGASACVVASLRPRRVPTTGGCRGKGAPCGRGTPAGVIICTPEPGVASPGTGSGLLTLLAACRSAVAMPVGSLLAAPAAGAGCAELMGIAFAAGACCVDCSADGAKAGAEVCAATGSAACAGPAATAVAMKPGSRVATGIPGAGTGGVCTATGKLSESGDADEVVSAAMSTRRVVVRVCWPPVVAEIASGATSRGIGRRNAGRTMAEWKEGSAAGKSVRSIPVINGCA